MYMNDAPAAHRAQAMPHNVWSPQAQANAVERTQLLEQIFRARSRVVVFQGPAGHGKTSLMLQAQERCVERGFVTGWLSLDGSDNDFNRFLKHVSALIENLDSKTSGAVLDETCKEDEDAITSTTDWVLSRILQVGQPVAIFLDDLHHVTGHMTLSFLRSLISCSPSRIRWFLASRIVPEIGLPRLVVGDQALVVHAPELRFTKEEVDNFFHESSPALSSVELDNIYAATEGWPAAVQLYKLALRSQLIRRSLAVNQSHHLQEMSGYLAENVLSQQEAHIQDFLLRTSILEKMSPHQCDNLLGIVNSHEVLRELERIGLFVRRIDSEEEWFTYHMLFSKFLQKRLHELHADKVNCLHVRAAHWYWEQGFPEDAMHHFLTAGDYANACQFFDRWAGALVPDGSLATVDHWSSLIPVAELLKVPNALTKVVWALIFLNRHSKLAPFMPLLEEQQQDGSASVDQAIASCMAAILQDDLERSLTYLQNIEPRPASYDRFRAFGLSAASNARAYAAMSLGDFDAALDLLSHARMLSERAGATFTLGYTLAKTGLIYFSQGHLREALVQLRSALADPRMHIAESVSKACMACAVVMTLYEANETDAAMDQFIQYRTMIENAGLHDYLVVCYRAVARIHDQQGHPELALEALEHAERQAFANNWPRVVTLLNWERVRRELLAGNLARAKTIAERLDDGIAPDAEHAWIRFSEETEDGVIGRIRLQIHEGRYEHALKAIHRELKSSSIKQRTVRKIKMHVLAALASHGCGDEKQAQRSLCLAIELAAAGGYVRSFIDEGSLLVHLAQKCLRLQSELPKCLLGNTGVEFLRRIVEAAGARTPTISYMVQQPAHSGPMTDTEQSLLQALTKKETKILSMLTAYMSNEQIAESLFVSRDTVKYHIKNIYGKLNAKNRLEAIRTALALGLST